MSKSNNNYIPVFSYPGGQQIDPTLYPNANFKWIDNLGGGQLSGPIPYGTIRPDGKPAHGGVATINPNGQHVFEYHRQQGYRGYK